MTAGFHEQMASSLHGREVAPTSPASRLGSKSSGVDPMEVTPPTPPAGRLGSTPNMQERQMDPVLRKRFEAQLAKADSDESPIEIGPSAKAEKKMDPVLQRRIEQQLAKEMGACASIDSNISSASKVERNFEPELKRRFEAQLAKEKGKAEPLPESLERTDRIYTRLDPKLQRRMERQQQKLVTGESDVKELGMKDHRIACESELERRMAKQREKVITGVSDVGDVGSAVGNVSRVNPELAAKFERRRLLEAEAAARAAGGDGSGRLERRGTCVRQLGGALRRMLCLGRRSET
mmetsp:Transcript_66460/g.183596  ORF Transcript_66460/g.183596 Transcript_66460/m.183596 type:complete len:293 (-) Transcript_66460:449-1327(-)